MNARAAVMWVGNCKGEKIVNWFCVIELLCVAETTFLLKPMCGNGPRHHVARVVEIARNSRVVSPVRMELCICVND